MMPGKILRVICLSFGFGFVLLGVAGVLAGVVAILDPVGTKMTDDADPLGTPPTVFESSVVILFYGLISLTGLLLISGRNRLADKFAIIKLR